MTMPAPAPRLTEIPRWDALVSDPSLFDELPSKVQDDIYTQIAMLEARFRAQVIARTNSQKVENDENDLILIEEAATMLKTSTDSLYSKWHKLPFAFKDPLDGKIKFSKSRIARYIESRLRRG